MYKPIPGNSEYKISLNNKIKKIDGSDCDLPIINNKVCISIIGKKYNLDLTWLALFAHFETYLPDEHKDKLFNISFQNTLGHITDSVSSKIMMFKVPLYINKVYRIIPCFTDLAVSKEGELIEVRTSRIIPKFNRGKTNYPEVFVYSPDKSRYCHIKKHRLVALAWCYNNNFQEKCIINHKDANKQNFRADNLEWVTFSENSKHAVIYKQRSDIIPCKIRNIFTKEINEFYTLNDASKFMGLIHPVRIRKNHHIPKLYAGRYELKLKSDNSNWFYEKLDSPVANGKYTITVKHLDSRIENFYNLKSFIEKFKLWNLKSQSIVCAISKASEKYPDLQFNYIDNFYIGNLECKNIKTGEVFECDSYKEISVKTNISKTTIGRFFKKYKSFILNDFIFRIKTINDEEWDYNSSFVKKEIRYECENIETKKVIGFKHFNDILKFLKCDPKTIKKRLNSNRPYLGYTFRSIEYMDKTA